MEGMPGIDLLCDSEAAGILVVILKELSRQSMNESWLEMTSLLAFVPRLDGGGCQDKSLWSPSKYLVPIITLRERWLEPIK